MSTLPIVLASGSRYRAALLEKLHLTFTAHASDLDETPLADETPSELARRLSEAKAKAIAGIFPGHLIIGSDQVAACDGHFLSKPGTRERAIRQLQMQSGQAVGFYTGISVLDSTSGRCLTDLDVCTVHFKKLSARQIERYLDLDQPYDCAGSFKSEGLGIALFSKIEGDDPNTLIGLPLIKLIALLSEFGIEIP